MSDLWSSGPAKSLINIGEQLWVDPMRITAVWIADGKTKIKADGQVFATSKSVDEVLRLFRDGGKR